MTFWEHLDELRSTVLKATALTVVFSIVAFLLKDELFQIVLAPKNADFIAYEDTLYEWRCIRTTKIHYLSNRDNQYRTCWTICNSHEDGNVGRALMCAPIHYISVDKNKGH